jgi:hypothetical protein
MPHENPLKSHIRIGRPFGIEVGLLGLVSRGAILRFLRTREALRL